MFDDLSFWSVLTVVRSALLIAGICAVAVWAARQPDEEAALLKRLTERRRSRCAGDDGGIGN